MNKIKKSNIIIPSILLFLSSNVVASNIQSAETNPDNSQKKCSNNTNNKIACNGKSVSPTINNPTINNNVTKNVPNSITNNNFNNILANVTPAVVFDGPSVYIPGTPGCPKNSDVSTDGVSLACVTKRPTSVSVAASVPFNRGLSGAGNGINAYSMNPARCKTTPALTKSWQHNIDMREYKRNAIDYFSLNKGESLSYKFTSPSTDTAGGFSYGEAAESGGSYPPVFMSITKDPCDFNASKVASGPAQDFCYQSGVAGLAMGWTTILGASNIPLSYCRLQKGVTYYLNIRFQDARPVSEGGSPTKDSCTSSPCGGVLQIL